jgi:hypothetical protein
MHYSSTMRFVPSVFDHAPRAARFRPDSGRGWMHALALAALALGAAACHDAPTDPLATLVTPETAPALAVEAILPTLPELAARTGTEARLSEPVMDWVGSWNDPEGGEALRRTAVERAAPVLAEALGPGGATQALAPLFQVARSLAALDPAPPPLAPMLAEVARGVANARDALDAGRPAVALREGLYAADRVRSASPEQVARALVARGEQALASLTDPARDPGPDQERGVQLLRRARQALDAGDYPRAVQRAFYGCQLLQAAPGF